MSLVGPFPVNIFFALFSIPFWIVGLTLIGSILFNLFGQTRLKITAEQISLTYECLGFKLQHPRFAARQDITAIECTQTDGKKKQNTTKTSTSAVVVWANAQPYSIYSSVSNRTLQPNIEFDYNPAIIELNWLAQELSQWLNVPLTQSKTNNK